MESGGLDVVTFDAHASDRAHSFALSVPFRNRLKLANFEFAPHLKAQELPGLPDDVFDVVKMAIDRIPRSAVVSLNPDYRSRTVQVDFLRT